MSALLCVVVLTLTPDEQCTAWPFGGVRLSDPAGLQDNCSIVADHDGGAIAVWRDTRNNPSATDIYAQRVDGAGAIHAGWPPSAFGAVVAPGNQYVVPDVLVCDLAGSVYVLSYDMRDISTGVDAYLQRLSINGGVADGWPNGGVPVCVLPLTQHARALLPDTHGGVYAVWEDERFGSGTRDVFIQRVDADGVRHAGWPLDGLHPFATVGERGGPSAVSDGDGGLLIGFASVTHIVSSYAMRLTGEGARHEAWNADGNLLSTTGFGPRLASDGQNGAYVAMLDNRTRPPGGDFLTYQDIYVQRISGEGVIWPGWPVDGVAVCTAPLAQQAHEIVPDGSGGAYITWEDYRSGGSDVYVQRVLADATIAPGWPTNGFRASGSTGFNVRPDIALDGSGGVFVVYDNPNEGAVYAQHITGTGQLSWGASGQRLSIGSAEHAAIASDERGGAIVAWHEFRNLTDNRDVYAQRLDLDGPTAVQLSLVSAEILDGVVRLAWHAPDAAGLSATVERRTETATWRDAGTCVGDGTGRLQFEDSDVVPGTQYGYRLRYLDGGVDSWSAETWVSVPTGYELALSGLRPNPASDQMTVAFTLGSAQAATLEVIDLAGRRLAARDVGSLGPGRHTIRLDETRGFAPGVYWLRLTQDGRSKTIKGLIAR